VQLQGSRIIVTGASTGIGRDVAITLARRGARVWGFARDAQRLEQLRSLGIHPVVGDVSDAADRSRLLSEVGEVDVLINNAGLGFEGLIETMTSEDVRRLYEVNVLGLIDLSLGVLPQMLRRSQGHIVNVGSIAGWAAGPPQSVYSSTKFAVAGFTDALRREVAHRGVHVCLIAPGPVRTEFMARCQTGAPAARSSPCPGWPV
jgi:short-subunit dehydrogenase